MCGICGVFHFGSQTVDLAIIQKMAATLTHRGPDDGGVWAEAEAGLALGFRRLAILDLSPSGRQPMLSADGQFAVVFNGEIYNHRELRRELEQQRVVFRGTSDTEVILEGASRWGMEAMLPRLWGMFALALWNRRERKLLLARDRLGKKPLYYAQLGNAFLFGSELKALRVHPAFRAEINREALTAYLRYGYVPAPHAIYQGVCKLPPGAYALVEPGQPPALRCYWDARQVAIEGLANPLELTDGEAMAELDTLLRDAIARRMIADVPLGAFLSGGIDSSVVAALMQAQSALPVKTFTIGFHIPGYNEAEQAQAVAAHLGTEHTELYVTPADAQAVIPRLPDLYDEPFADSSQIPTFLVSALARRHVTVSLSGDGGDEVFGGYNRYTWADALWRRLGYLPAAARRWLARGIEGVPPAAWDKGYRAVEWAIPRRWRQRTPGDKFHKLAGALAARNADALYLRLASLWQQPEAVAASGKAPASVVEVPDIDQLIPGFVERMMYFDLVTYLPDDILVKTDRASMGISLEVRCPLLDHRVVEWAWRLPLRFKQRDSRGKWLLRQVLYRYVPPSLVERPKAGFGIPIDAWLRGPLREWAEALLDEPRLRREGFLVPAPIQQAWREHLSGRRNDQHRLWVVLMFQAWLERWGKP